MASSRTRIRAACLVGVMAVLTAAATALLVAAHPTRTPAPAQASGDPMTFTADTMIIVFVITTDGAPAFESLLTRVRDALARSDKPELKAQASHWKVIKVNEPKDGAYQYMSVIDQVARNQTYDPFRILASTGTPADEVRALYETIGPSIKGVTPIASTLLLEMGGSR